jgi:hypothetical protein
VGRPEAVAPAARSASTGFGFGGDLESLPPALALGHPDFTFGIGFAKATRLARSVR